MIFEPTISLGTLLHLAGLVITVVVLVVRVQGWIVATHMEIARELHTLHSANLAALGKIDQRLAVVETKVTDLWERREPEG